MRKDMPRLLTERPRKYGDAFNSYKKRVQRDMENEAAPAKESMRSPYRGNNTKDLNENLRPLVRWLEKQVGRPWDKVYSELRQNLDFANAVQKHVWDHAKWMVELQVEVIDGRPHYRGARFRLSGELPPGTLWVDPATGILRTTRKVARRRVKASPPTTLPGDNRLVRYGRLSGIWYELQMEVDHRCSRWCRENRGADDWIAKHGHDPAWYNYLTNSHKRFRQEYYGDPELRCVSFRQLNSKEIRKLKLRQE